MRGLQNLTEIRDPLRGEWLDADFKVKNNKLYINYAHKLINGNLNPQRSELLEEYLAADKQIDLDNLLINSTKHGLPKKNVKAGSLHYWAPDNDNNSFFAVVFFNNKSDAINRAYNRVYKTSGYSNPEPFFTKFEAVHNYIVVS